MVNKYFCRWIKEPFSFIKGDGYKFSLEAKIFHVFSLITIIGSFFTFLLNLYIGLFSLAVISIGVCFCLFCLFYLSRFKRRLKLAVFLSAAVVHISLGISFFYNEGINGSTLLLFVVSLFFVMAVSSTKNAIYLFIGNALLVGLLIAWEYIYPASIQAQYPSRAGFFIDTYITYLITSALIYAGTSYLVRSYIKQRRGFLEKTSALERINNEKDKLFSVISHDLRTPLANVQQYLEMITTVDLNKEEKRIIENKLLDITRNAQELLTNLLQWTRHQMDGVNITLQPIYLQKEITPTIEHLKSIALKKSITLNQYVPPNLSLIADPDMLSLIIRNILHNAIKFTNFGGEINLTAEEYADICLISISDNGKGIPIDQQEKLFSLRIKSKLGTNKEKGTGMGLMLCKEYTILQKGEIWFESEEGKGTTFYLSFPIGYREDEYEDLIIDDQEYS